VHSMASMGARQPLKARLWATVQENWHLGFTAFGGPPVHFKIVSASLFLPSQFRRRMSRVWPVDGVTNKGSYSSTTNLPSS
jgi:hypothetical protein